MDFEVYENKNPRPSPTRPSWLSGGSLLIWAIIVLWILGSIVVNLVADYIWMDSLGFAQVFTTIFVNKLLLGVVGFILFGVVLWLNLQWIRRVYLRVFDSGILPPIVLEKRLFFWSSLGASILFGLLGSSLVQGLGWETFLKNFNATPFGQTDPLFLRDISFYAFSLPFWKFLLGTLVGLTLVQLILCGAAYSVFRIYARIPFAKIHLSVIVVLLGVLLALQHLLAPFDTLLTNQVNVIQDSVVYGTSFTDRVINIPMAYVNAAMAILAAAILVYGLRSGRLQLLMGAPLLYIGVMMAGGVASMVVQNFIVSPNEFIRESPYLKNNLDYTRSAYGLDRITESEHPGSLTLSEDLLERNRLIIENIRINDARPLVQVYNQLQTFRTYYEFNDVDIDRYYIDGEYQQVFLGARELNTTHLPEQAQTWMNQTLRYTHGYGVAMSHVNQVTPQGQPEYMVKDLPPNGVVEVTRPQIYFGEEPYGTVVVNSAIEEFDYPSGDSNVSYRFSGDTGIPMTFFNRLIFAVAELSPRYLLSGQITAESQLLQTRNIVDRLERIAPFLTYDSDPYIVIREDGTLVWMVDAYTATSQYPYSEMARRGVNYIANPVKVTVDAYTGEVHYYLLDPAEPLAQTYQKIFPNLFTTEIPEDIRAHFRYPESLFSVQAEMYRTYHMENLEVFYNREDFWQFPTENYYESDTVMEPYYVTMKLPGNDVEEFILMMPFTPNNRQNMIAWMAARSDGENYGEVLVYNFPKQRTVYGPQQIENRINQNAQISQELNLWSQGGSRVIRGNLLVVPIEDTLLYVEPLYIESANQTSLPEVKRMILAYGDYIVMEDTFDNALRRLMEMVGEGVPDLPEAGEGQPGPAVLTTEQKLERLGQLFSDYQSASSQGQFSEAGRLLEQLQQSLVEWGLLGSPQDTLPAQPLLPDGSAPPTQQEDSAGSAVTE